VRVLVELGGGSGLELMVSPSAFPVLAPVWCRVSLF
jgi:hypothetical protein